MSENDTDAESAERVRREAESASEEWDFCHIEGSVMDREYPTSIPCQLRFVDETSQHTERFHAALGERGYSPIDHNPADKATADRPHYDGEVLAEENHNRIKIIVFRGGAVRLYPHDDYVPTVDELAALVEALEKGFEASLEHDPIDQEVQTA